MKSSKYKDDGIVKVDRVTKEILKNMELGSKIKVINNPLNSTIIIEKMCEVKDYNGRKVKYDLKKFLIKDTVKSQSKKHFNEIELNDLDIIKKYVTNLQDSRLRREMVYHKLLILSNIVVGDIISKNTKPRGLEYFLVLPFKDTQADRVMVRCKKIDKNWRLTDKEVNLLMKGIRKTKSYKIRK